jgi:hypothetical protein
VRSIGCGAGPLGGPAAPTRTMQEGRAARMAVKDLKRSPMMAHLLDALERGEDIGHYGQLTFAMIARHFLTEEELVKVLAKGKDMTESKAGALVRQVAERGYNPPRREKILEWQALQDFPICPDPEDPNACNPYRELDFPEEVIESIEEYREQRYEAETDQPGR